jgi:hypothetical protein
MPWDALRGAPEHADDHNNAPSLLSAPQANDGPMSAGELIAWHLENGTTIQALRAMFPDFFQEDSGASERPPGPPEFHEPELWQWNGAPDMENAFDEFDPTGQNVFHPHL